MKGSSGTCNEVPVFFASRDGADLFGVLSEPSVRPRGVGVLLAWGAGPYPSSGRNRLRARLARRLAAHGYHAFRFDYRGIGESSGPPRGVRFDHPWATDVLAAREYLVEVGVPRVITVGYCFGARAVLSSIPGAPDPLAVVLVGAPVHDQDHVQTASRRESVLWHLQRALTARTLSNLLRSRKRHKYLRMLRTRLALSLGLRPSSASGQTADPSEASPRFLDPLAHLVERRVPTLFVYAAGDRFQSGFQAACTGRLGNLVSRAGSGVQVRTIQESLNLQTGLQSQEELLDIVERWMSALPDRN